MFRLIDTKAANCQQESIGVKTNAHLFLFFSRIHYLHLVVFNQLKMSYGHAICTILYFGAMAEWLVYQTRNRRVMGLIPNLSFIDDSTGNHPGIVNGS